MKRKRLLPFLLSFCLLFAFTVEAAAAAVSSEQKSAAAYLKEQGIMVGDQAGNMNLDKGLTRVELATILTRLNGNPEHIQNRHFTPASANSRMSRIGHNSMLATAILTV